MQGGDGKEKESLIIHNFIALLSLDIVYFQVLSFPTSLLSKIRPRNISRWPTHRPVE